jgi:hypothetical protein
MSRNPRRAYDKDGHLLSVGVRVQRFRGRACWLGFMLLSVIDAVIVT